VVLHLDVLQSSELLEGRLSEGVRLRETECARRTECHSEVLLAPGESISLYARYLTIRVARSGDTLLFLGTDGLALVGILRRLDMKSRQDGQTNLLRVELERHMPGGVIREFKPSCLPG
jgi:hypothetical protein